MKKVITRCVAFILVFLCVFSGQTFSSAAESTIVDSKSITHVHTGDNTASGGCHTKENTVQVEAACNPTRPAPRVDNVSANCPTCNAWTPQRCFGTWAYHQCSIGGVFESGKYICEYCGTITRSWTQTSNPNHTYTATSTTWDLDCGMDETTVVATINLNKNRSNGYALSVSATGTTIDSYAWNDAGTPGGTTDTEVVTGFGLYSCTISYTVEGVVHTDTLNYDVTDFDDVPPEVTLNFDDSTWSQNKTISVVSATDNSELNATAFRFFNGTSWTEWGTEQQWTVSGNGNYAVDVRDIYDNINHQDILISHIDRNAPYISSISCDNTQYAKEKIVSVQAGDSESGVKCYSYSTDGTSWTEWSADNTYKVNHNCTVYVRILDNAGNTSGWDGSVSVPVNNVDTTAPSLSISTSPSGWSTEKTVVVQAGDSESGINSYAYSIDGINWISAGNTYTVKENCTVYVIVTDKALNQSSGSIEVNQIDLNAPEVIIAGRKGWVQKCDIFVSGIDEESGIATEAYSYSMDGMSWSEWSAENKYIATQSGIVYIKMRDNVGNIAGEDLSLFHEATIDTLPPEIVINENDEAVIVTATDDHGLAAEAYSYSMDGMSWSEWSEDSFYRLIDLESGEGTIYIQVRDAAGNIASADYTVVLIDINETPMIWSLPATVATTTSTSAAFVFAFVFFMFGFGNIKVYGITESGKKKFLFRTNLSKKGIKLRSDKLKKNMTNKIILQASKKSLKKHKGEAITVFYKGSSEVVTFDENMEFNY